MCRADRREWRDGVRGLRVRDAAHREDTGRASRTAGLLFSPARSSRRSQPFEASMGSRPSSGHPGPLLLAQLDSQQDAGV